MIIQIQTIFVKITLNNGKTAYTPQYLYKKKQNFRMFI